MNDPRIVQLEQLFVGGNVYEAAVFFKNMPETDQQFLAPVVLAWVKKLTYECHTLRKPIVFALLATCSFEEIKKSDKKLRQVCAPMDNEIVVGAMKQRKPIWIEEFIIWYMHYESPLNSQDYWWAYWELRQAGICPAIYDPAILFRMVHSLSPANATFYRAHPELLQNEFWYLFEMEFPTPFWFMANDRDYGNWSCYSSMYLEFVKDGLIDRKRLLHTTLGTLKFAYKEFEMRWYTHLHRQLTPTLDEIKELEPRYMELLADMNACSVALGFDMLMELEKGKRLDDAMFLDSITPLFNEKAKIRSKTALQLVAKIAKRKPDLRRNAIKVTLAGLRHGQVDVQTEAVVILQHNLTANDHDDIKEIMSLLPMLAASPQKILHQVLDALDHSGASSLANDKPQSCKAKKSTLSNCDEVPDRRHLQPLDVPRLGVLKRLVPIATQDELIDTIIRVSAFPDNLDEYEQIYDAINRLHGEPCDNFEIKISPIRKGFTEMDSRGLYTMLSPYAGLNSSEETRAVPRALLLLIAGWMSQIRAEPDAKTIIVPFGHKTIRLFRTSIKQCAHLQYAQARETCFRISQGISLTPLSAATHHGGWIDPLVLVDRIVSDPNGLAFHDHYDKVVSLYRLPIDHRAEALKKLENTLPDDSYVNAVRAILSCRDTLDEKLPDCYRKAHETDIAIRNHKPLFSYEPEFVASADAREMAENPQTSPLPPAPGRISEVKLSAPDPEIEPGLYPLSFYHQLYLLPCWTYITYSHLPTLCASIQWRAQLVPAVRGPFYWYASEKLLTAIDDPYDGPGPDAFIEPLLDPNEPIGFPAAMAVFAALTARGESLATLAQDVLVQAMNDGRADSTVLVQAARYWMQGGISKMVRWTKRLQTIATDSHLTTESVRQILIGIIPGMDNKVSGGFLELLHELCVTLEKGVEDEPCRKFLEGIKGSGKAAKHARAVLNLSMNCGNEHKVEE